MSNILTPQDQIEPAPAFAEDLSDEALDRPTADDAYYCCRMSVTAPER